MWADVICPQQSKDKTTPRKSREPTRRTRDFTCAQNLSRECGADNSTCVAYVCRFSALHQLLLDFFIRHLRFYYSHPVLQLQVRPRNQHNSHLSSLEAAASAPWHPPSWSPSLPFIFYCYWNFESLIWFSPFLVAYRKWFFSPDFRFFFPDFWFFFSFQFCFRVQVSGAEEWEGVHGDYEGCKGASRRWRGWWGRLC